MTAMTELPFDAGDLKATSTCRIHAATPLQLRIHKLPLLRPDWTYVPHVRQCSSWDCGLACVLMVLRAAGIHTETFSSLWRRCQTTSVWTIDLAHLLRQCGLAVQFMTQMLGPNPAYADERFYMDHMQQDAIRVHAGFQAAAQAGIDVQCRSLSSLEIGEFLRSGRNIAILLADKWRLDLSISNTPKAYLPCSQGDFRLPRLSYTGHYVVACGYRTDSEEFLLLDPAHGPDLICMHATDLDAARKAFGTDEDLILISL